MARVLILSSWVAFGHVGLSAATPALQVLGHAVTQLPTTILSNHPGWPNVAGCPVPPDELSAMIQAIDANGWLADHDALLTGYLPTPAHVDLAADLVSRLRGAKHLRVVVDPVLGDHPKGLYVPESVAQAVRDQLLPLADVLTPNAFELGWLCGRGADRLEDATDHARELRPKTPEGQVLVTSPPISVNETGCLEVDETGAKFYAVPRHDSVPHGPGDVFAALIAAGLPTGESLGHLAALVKDSQGADHLRIAEAAPRWTQAASIPATPISHTTQS